MKRKTAVVLGGTVPHADLIRHLKDRGYFTVLVDYFEAPPAAADADVHRRESAMDEDAVLRIAKEYDAGLVLSSCLDQQMNIAMSVSEKMGLPHPFSSETAEKITNKIQMKKIMTENRIPTARYKLIDRETELSGLDLNFPLIVKPADSCGSAGVYRLDGESRETFRSAVDRAAEFSGRGRVLIEEFMIGTEMGVHGYIESGKFHLLFGTCKMTSLQDGFSMQFCNLYIPRMKPALRQRLEKIGDQIAEAFGLPDYSPLFMQVIVRDDGEVYVIEFSARVAGGTTSGVAQTYTGFDLITCSIDSYLGVKTVQKGHALEKYVCNFPIYAEEGVFDHIAEDMDLQKEGIIQTRILLKSPGDHISREKPSSSNVLKYLIEGESAGECYRRLKAADEAADIIDAQGRSMRNGKSPLKWEMVAEQLKRIVEEEELETSL